MLNGFGLNGLCFACDVGCKGERGWWVKRGGGLTRKNGVGKFMALKGRDVRVGTAGCKHFHIEVNFVIVTIAETSAV